MSSEVTSQLYAGITPTDVRWYALGRGWKSLPSRNPAVAIFVKPDLSCRFKSHNVGATMTWP